MTRLPLEELETAFKTLGNINRLKLLLALQTPKGYGEIELPPSRADDRGSDQRSISRQAVRNHIKRLQGLDLVQEVDDPDGSVTRFVVNHARLFVLLDQMREMAIVKPAVDLPDQTMGMTAPARGVDPGVPHLALARGVEEGRTFPLGEADAPATWSVGRRPDADVPLDYDAYVSADHAEILRRDEGFLVRDLPENTNGTFLNWSRMDPGSVAPLEPGDILGVGRSLLVFRR